MREREAETQAEGEAGSIHREPDVGFDPGSPGSRPGPKAGAKPLRHPGIPTLRVFSIFIRLCNHHHYFIPHTSITFGRILQGTRGLTLAAAWGKW